MYVNRVWRPRHIAITMSEEEFREMVEWLELIAPDDGCTRDWREQYDRQFPASVDDG